MKRKILAILLSFCLLVTVSYAGNNVSQEELIVPKGHVLVGNYNLETAAISCPNHRIVILGVRREYYRSVSPSFHVLIVEKDGLCYTCRESYILEEGWTREDCIPHEISAVSDGHDNSLIDTHWYHDECSVCDYVSSWYPVVCEEDLCWHIIMDMEDAEPADPINP